jgi:hypothetical protein
MNGPALTEPLILVGGDKVGAGAEAGGSLGGADIDASAGVGAGDAGGDVGVDADVDTSGDTDAGGDVNADTDTSSDTSAGADSTAGTDAGTETSVDADTSAGADADTDADLSTDTSSGAAVGGNAATGDTTVSGATGAEAATGESGVSSSAPMDSPSAAPSVGVSSVPAAEPAPARAAPQAAPPSASATIAIPAGSVPGSVPVPFFGPGAHQAEREVDANRFHHQTALPADNCVDRIGFCIGTAGSSAMRQAGSNSTPSSVSGVSNGAVKPAVPAVVTPAPTVASAAPQPAARTGAGLGISLVDPVRKDHGLLIQGIIVNSSAEPQAVPPMQISLLNSANQVVQRSIVKAPGITIGQGQPKSFKAFVEKLPPNISRVTVAFIGSGTP